jgi:photosystem II stability/assembly factor-like uncharacterized protein
LSLISKKSFFYTLLTLLFSLNQFIHPQWEKISEVGRSSCILTFDDIVIVGTDNGIYRSTDEGEGWVHFDLASFDLTVTDLTKNDKYIFAGTLNGIYSSPDTGKTWLRIGPDYSILSVYTLDSIILAGIQGGGLLYSNDYGENWTWVEGGHFYSYIMDEGKIFAGTFDGIYTSVDSGLTWQIYSQGGRIVSSVSRNEKYFYATLWDSLLRSDDFGLTWEKSNEGLPLGDHNIYSVFAFDSLVFAGLTMNGVYLSKNNGITWEKFDEGIEISDTTYHVKFAINSKKVFVSFLYNSLWKYPLSSITEVKNQNNQTTGNFFLYQNYPNPFNPTTKIRYQVPASLNPSEREVFVSLKLYNILGSEVATLVNDKQEPGYYEIDFSAIGGSASGENASYLASGMYIYRLSAGNYTSAKKMILLK